MGTHFPAGQVYPFQEPSCSVLWPSTILGLGNLIKPFIYSVWGWDQWEFLHWEYFSWDDIFGSLLCLQSLHKTPVRISLKPQDSSFYCEMANPPLHKTKLRLWNQLNCKSRFFLLFWGAKRSHYRGENRDVRDGPVLLKWKGSWLSLRRRTFPHGGDACAKPIHCFKLCFIIYALFAAAALPLYCQLGLFQEPTGGLGNLVRNIKPCINCQQGSIICLFNHESPLTQPVQQNHTPAVFKALYPLSVVVVGPFWRWFGCISDKFGNERWTCSWLQVVRLSF